MTDEELLFKLLRYELSGEPIEWDGAASFDVAALIDCAKRHDLAHLVADAFLKSGAVTEKNDIFKAVRKQKFAAIHRETQRTFYSEKISALFDGEKIDHVFLKGLILADLYPERWMRTSCDMDILIHESDLDRAKDALLNGGFSTDGVKHYHDMSFYDGDIHLELHFSIRENEKTMDELLGKVWEHCEKVGEHKFAESREFFAFHHVAHMAYHFMSGGCGIRPFIDLYLMRENGFYDDNGLIALLDQCDLTVFYRAACELSDVWLKGKEHGEVTEKMERFVLNGGVYGNESNSIKTGVANSSRTKYLFKIAFLPYENMCEIYPSLKKHKILLPFCYVHRFFSKLFGKDRKKVKGKIKKVMSVSDEAKKETGDLLSELGLHG